MTFDASLQVNGRLISRGSISMRPRIEVMRSVVTASNEGWLIYLRRAWAGRDGWNVIAPVIVC